MSHHVAIGNDHVYNGSPVERGERGSSAPMMNKYRLMSPGPTPIPPEVSAAGALPIIHHRPPEFGEVFTRVNEHLKRDFLTENDIFTYAASGTGASDWRSPSWSTIGARRRTTTRSPTR